METGLAKTIERMSSYPSEQARNLRHFFAGELTKTLQHSVESQWW